MALSEVSAVPSPFRSGSPAGDGPGVIASPGPAPGRFEVELPGTRLSYRVRGSGPCVLLLHGLGSSGASWDGLAGALAADHFVVVPDLPGHGRSRIYNGDHSLGAVATGLRDLLAVLGRRRATVIGHSLGGGVAMHFAYQYPEWCERLVLVAPGGMGAEVHPSLRAMSLPGAGPVLAAVSAAGRWRTRIGLGAPPVSARAVGDGSGATADETGGLAGDGSTRRFLRSLRTVVGYSGQRIWAVDHLAALAGSIPTLVVWGQDDGILPVAQAAAARAAVPELEVVVTPGGHCPHLEDPDGFGRLVRRFLSAPPGRVDAGEWGRMLAGGSRNGLRPVRQG